jgi:TRAP-type C4-dicarboxylate transport system permease small subunit
VKALKFLNARVEEACVVFSLACMSVIIFLQVFMRYVMQNSLSWSEELARYLFILLVNMGISYGVKMKKHICVEVFTSWLPAKTKAIIRILSDVVFLVFAVVIVYYGLETAGTIFVLNQTSPALEIQMGIIYALLPISYAMVLIRLVQNIVEAIRNLKSIKKEV